MEPPLVAVGGTERDHQALQRRQGKRSPSELRRCFSFNAGLADPLLLECLFLNSGLLYLLLSNLLLLQPQFQSADFLGRQLSYFLRIVQPLPGIYYNLSHSTARLAVLQAIWQRHVGGDVT